MQSDRLAQMFDRQKRLQVDIYDKIGEDKSALSSGFGLEKREEKFMIELLLLIKECTESLDEINFKPHVSERKPINKEALTIELIDILKYWMNLCIIFDIDADMVYDVFRVKSAIVEKKILGRSYD